MNQNLLMAFGLTLFAGLSTGIGSAIAFFGKQTNTRFLSGALGFSAGVMIYLSFVEILTKSLHALIQVYGKIAGTWATIGGFFSGILIIAIIDRLIPSYENPHEVKHIEDMTKEQHVFLKKEQSLGNVKLLRMGIFTALAIAIHNFPEGLATFIAALSNPTLGVSIAVAIAIHNIPEGISVSVPVFFATGSRKKAFQYSFLSGISEPVGAIVGYILIRSFLSDAVFGFLFAAVGGIMVFIALDELLPTAREYGEGHIAIYGVVSGMALMAISLALFV